MPRINPYAHLRDALDPIAREYGVYLAYQIDAAEYVTTVKRDDVRGWLRENGYSPAYLSAAKRAPDSDALHWLSYARRPDEHPEEAIGTGLEKWDPGQAQFHVHVFANGDVYSHYELSSRLRPIGGEPPAEYVSRLRGHYLPTWDDPDRDREEWTYIRGTTDLQ